MNRQQRREQHGNVKMVNLRDVTMPHEMTREECAIVIPMRIQDNLTATGHPFHHLTESGSIVAPDPTLEYYINRLRKVPEYASVVTDLDNQTKRDYPGAKPAVKVNRKYYGFDPYERH
jgi:hypothetical protein